MPEPNVKKCRIYKYKWVSSTRGVELWSLSLQNQRFAELANLGKGISCESVSSGDFAQTKVYEINYPKRCRLLYFMINHTDALTIMNKIQNVSERIPEEMAHTPVYNISLSTEMRVSVKGLL